MFIQNEVIDGTYMIIKEIGSGGTGVVFLAYHMRLEKYVVVKKIKDNLIDIVNVRSEVDILKKLHHKYLPQVYDFVQVDNNVYTVIDYIEGYDLEYYMEQGYSFTEEELIRWMMQLCEVLDYLHSQKPMILHSDIKPSNIIIDRFGNICLIDFNISLDNQSEASISGLSPYYASPEQVEKAVAFMSKKYPNKYADFYCKQYLTQGTDIYSLGATFYYLMTRRRPYILVEEFRKYIVNGDKGRWDFVNTFPMGVEKKLNEMGLNYSNGLIAVVSSAMELNINRRYKSTEEMLRTLSKLTKYERKYRTLLWARYSSILWYVICLVVSVLCIIGGKRKMDLKIYNDDVQKFFDYYNAGNINETISVGTGILDNADYSKYLFEDRKTQADIFHGIGDCYYYLEDYTTSTRYYKSAYEVGDNKLTDVYYRDYAISMIKQDKGYISSAKDLIKLYDDGHNNGIKIVSAQISYEENNLEMASLLSQEVIDSASDNRLDLAKAYEVKSQIANRQSDSRSEIEYREKIYSINGMDKNNMRVLAARYIEYADTSTIGEVVKHDCYDKARKIYESIVTNEFSMNEDKYNLCNIYLMINEKETIELAEKMMMECISSGKGDYRADMILAYAYHLSERDGLARQYCSRAINRYNRMIDNEDEDYNKLLELSSQIGD